MTPFPRLWHKILTRGGRCIFVLADTCRRNTTANLPDMIVDLATKSVGGYRVVGVHREEIPDARRVRRGFRGSSSETFLVLKRN